MVHRINNEDRYNVSIVKHEKRRWVYQHHIDIYENVSMDVAEWFVDNEDTAHWFVDVEEPRFVRFENILGQPRKILRFKYNIETVQHTI